MRLFGNEPRGPGKPSAFFTVFWREFGNLIKLNLLFLLTCLPIVTIPASCTALARITLNMLRGENQFLCSSYFCVFRREFWRSLGAGAILTAALGLCLLSLWFYASAALALGKGFLILAGAALVLALLVLLVGSYVFQMLALVDLKLSALFKNAALLAVVQAKRNLRLLVTQGAICAAWFLLLPGSCLPALVILFSAMGLVTSYLLYDAIHTYACTEQATTQPV